MAAGPICGPCLLASCSHCRSGTIADGPPRWPSAAASTARRNCAAAARWARTAVVTVVRIAAIEERA